LRRKVAALRSRAPLAYGTVVVFLELQPSQIGIDLGAFFGGGGRQICPSSHAVVPPGDPEIPLPLLIPVTLGWLHTIAILWATAPRRRGSLSALASQSLLYELPNSFVTWRRILLLSATVVQLLDPHMLWLSFGIHGSLPIWCWRSLNLLLPGSRANPLNTFFTNETCAL
jgi:hypothetical protein